MPYTYTKIAPTPSWVTVSSSGLATIDYNAAPNAGYSGIARFRVSDGANTATIDYSLNVLPRYSVELDYRETSTIKWRVKAGARIANQIVLSPLVVKWRAIAGAKTSDNEPLGALFVKWRAIAGAKASDSDPSGGGIPGNAVTINGDVVTVDGDIVTVN